MDHPSQAPGFARVGLLSHVRLQVWPGGAATSSHRLMRDFSRSTPRNPLETEVLERSEDSSQVTSEWQSGCGTSHRSPS
jgi:hypothetical protein